MGLRNLNSTTLILQRGLAKASAESDSAMERLSSGLRINRASDDAASLGLATSLDTSQRVLSQSIRNINDGISFLSVADSALEALTGITTRQLELATQASNGVYSDVQRQALQKESIALTQEYNRILSTTNFNGITLFQNSGTSSSIEINGSSIRVEIGTELGRQVGTGTFLAAGTAPLSSGQWGWELEGGDFNNDGKVDVVVGGMDSRTQVLISNGDGTFLAPFVLGAYAPSRQVNVVDINGDGKLDITGSVTGSSSFAALGNGDGTFSYPTYQSTYGLGLGEVAGDINNDGKIDIITLDTSTGTTYDFLGTSASVRLGNGDGTFRVVVSFATGAGPSTAVLSDADNDGRLDLVVGTTQGVKLLRGNGNGTFLAATTILSGTTVSDEIETRDFNFDGKEDLVTGSTTTGAMYVLLSNGDGTYRQSTYSNPSITTTMGFDINDINGDGVSDITIGGYSGVNNIQTLLGNTDGTFSYGVNFVPPSAVNRLITEDVNGDGIPDLLTTGSGSTDLSIFLGNGTNDNSSPFFELTSASYAHEALSTIQEQLERISAERGAIGAQLSRLHAAVSVTQAMHTAYQEAHDRIMDADIAADVATMIRANVLKQANVALLASAKLDTESVLKLIRGA
jgi:flagellin-like hook-associated protein FlgL